MFLSRSFKGLVTVALLPLMISCSGIPGPDKSAEGILLGAAVGAGAGAVIGNQTNSLGPGAAIGAAIGAVAGMLHGLGLDVLEGFSLDQQRELDALQVLVMSNQRELKKLQADLDDRQRQLVYNPVGTTIYFDEGRASLHMGSAIDLERLANGIKLNPYVGAVEIHGHSEDFGDKQKNQLLSEARAKTVFTFLTQHGVSSHLLKIVPHGATQPITTNDTSEGKQLNRRVEVVLLK